jgi:hypothetical protein
MSVKKPLLKVITLVTEVMNKYFSDRQRKNLVIKEHIKIKCFLLLILNKISRLFLNYITGIFYFNEVP